MGCASCAKKKANSYQEFRALESPPFRATDIMVYDLNTSEARKFQSGDWNTNVTNVLLFVPSIEAISEFGTLTPQDGVVYTYVTNQPLHQIKDYYDNEGVELAGERFFVSYLLPSRMGLLHNGFTKKAVVYIMRDGDMSVQQLFYNSTFNYNHITGFLEDYNNDNN